MVRRSQKLYLDSIKDKLYDDYKKLHPDSIKDKSHGDAEKLPLDSPIGKNSFTMKPNYIKLNHRDMDVAYDTETNTMLLRMGDFSVKCVSGGIETDMDLSEKLVGYIMYLFELMQCVKATKECRSVFELILRIEYYVSKIVKLLTA